MTKKDNQKERTKELEEEIIIKTEIEEKLKETLKNAEVANSIKDKFLSNYGSCVFYAWSNCDYNSDEWRKYKKTKF